MDSKIGWYFTRLSKMLLKEMPYRLNQALRAVGDKYFPRCTTSKNFLLKGLTEDPFRNLKDGLADNQFYSLLDNKCFLKSAEKFLNHEFDVFGIKAQFGTQINFHLDPKTGKTWPLKFWNDIDYRDGSTFGGIKFAWELNRLHHWPKLAIVYSQTRDQRFLQEIFRELEHWLETNPYPLGINWISGVELGIRLVNLFYTLKILGNKVITVSQRKLVVKFIFLHARHLYRYPSKYSSCANHAIAEALGLFIAGLLFPYLKNARKWKYAGQKILEREVKRQIYPDGSSFEHTVPYLQFVADHFLIYCLICKEYKEGINDEIIGRLKTICNFISSIIDINGNIPMIGDDDDGYLLKLWFGEHNNFLSLLNTGGILFNRPDWIHPSAHLDFKTLLLLGNLARSRWEKLKKEQAWRRGSYYFQNAGIAVIAHHKSEREILFVGNSGPLGLEPLGGHGHADALSFWLSIDGKPFFVDTGTYLYHSGDKWRRYFRSTAAHNTIQVDGLDQAEQITDFMFGDFYNVRLIEWSEKGDQTGWIAEHTGYQRLSDPVIHRREVRYIKREYSFKITDTLKCHGKHDVKMLFHLHPDIEALTEGENTFRLSADDVTVILRVDNKLKCQIITGSEELLAGWYSRCFNRLHKTITLAFSKEICGDSVFKSEVIIL